jgi:hypothetical protein
MISTGYHSRDLQGARFETRHVEQVADQAIGLSPCRRCSGASSLFVFRQIRVSFSSVEAAPAMIASGGRSWETDDKRGVSEPLGIGLEALVFGFLAEIGALHRSRHLARKGIEEVSLIGVIEPVAILWKQAHHTNRSARCDEWQVEPVALRERCGGEPRLKTRLPSAVRNAELGTHVRLEPCALVDGREVVAGPWNEDDHTAREDLCHVLRGGRQDGVDALGAGQIAAQVVEDRRAMLSRPCGLRVIAHTSREAADHHGHEQHHRKRDDGADPEPRAVERRDEEEVVNENGGPRRTADRAQTERTITMPSRKSMTTSASCERPNTAPESAPAIATIPAAST